MAANSGSNSPNSHFKIGEKVVCTVNCRTIFLKNRVFLQENCPKKGDILKIRDIENTGSFIVLRFEEIVNPPRWLINGRMAEMAFPQEWFRKIDYSFGTEVLEEIMEAEHELELV